MPHFGWIYVYYKIILFIEWVDFKMNYVYEKPVYFQLVYKYIILLSFDYFSQEA